MKQKFYIITCILAFLVSLYPAVKDTYDFIRHAHGLVILAGLSEDDISINPYAKNSSFVSPSLAKWLLVNSDYPYKKCDETIRSINCKGPLIQWAGRGIYQTDPVVDQRLYEIIEYFISRNEPINQRYQGLYAIHEAILFNNARYFKILLNAGVDIEAKTYQPDIETDSLNAKDYLDYMSKNKKGNREELFKIWDKFDA
jgi:ankyrin repeat protein